MPVDTTIPVLPGAKRIGTVFGGAPLDIIKLVAATGMVFDHSNNILFHHRFIALWLAGRLAFPLFAFVIAVHLLRGTRIVPYVQRLVLLAVISQPAYAIGFATSDANTVFTLAVGVVLATLLIAQKRSVQHAAFAVGLAVIFTPWLRARTGLDYGLAGMLLPAALVLTMAASRAHAVWLALLVVGISLYTQAPLAVDMGAIFVVAFGCVAIVLLSALFRGRERFLPTYAFYAFYPAHLLILAAISAVWRG